MINGVKFKYPFAKKSDTVDDYFGVKIRDPYRWLEDSSSLATKSWVKLQNQLTEDLIAEMPYRSKIKKRLTQLWDYEKVTIPLKVAGHYFVLKNNGLEDQDSCYVKRKGETGYQLLIDAKKLSKDGTASIARLFPSKDGQYLAYSVSKCGSDWLEFFVIDLKTGKHLPDHINWIKFSPIAWYNDGFFYSSFSNQQAEPPSQESYSKVYFHKIGTPAKEDILINEDIDGSAIGAALGISADEQFLFLFSFQGTHGYNVSYRTISIDDKPFTPIFTEKGYDFQILSNDEESISVFTNFKAPNYRVVKIYFDKLNPEFWEELVPEKPYCIYWAYAAGGKYIIHYLKDMESVLEVYNTKGIYLNSISIPEKGSVKDHILSNWDETDVFFKFESYIYSPTIYKYNTESEELNIYNDTKIDVKQSDFVSNRIFFTSKDGTKIPMFITHKKGIVLNGSTPTLLYGYGGFKNPNLPSFDVSKQFFLEQGGIYAVANIRGGGEYGRAWHRAGILEKKQNSFDDFIAAAEYLIAENYTNTNRLAICGRSNGGLLVGAVLNQRPDLFKVALPIVGVMDMLRYHKFTLGRAWTVEYGSSEVKEQFEYLIKYSPLHNIKATNYPATLVLTADHDDRVVPAHSYKYISTLQEYQKGDAPVIIRIDGNAGHGSGKSTYQLINEWTDIWSFVMKHLEMDYVE